MDIVLITSAIKEELVDLEFLDKKIIKKRKFYLYPLGIGKLNSIFNLAELFFKEFYKKNIEIIFLGSCGSYSSVKNDFVFSNLFINYDYGVITKKSKSLNSISSIVETDIGNLSKNFINYYDFQKSIVNSTDSITLTKVSEKKIFELEPTLKTLNLPVVENLEVYSIGKFCKNYQIPFTSFLAITNRVGKKASIEWERNYKVLGKKLNEILKKYIESI